MFLRITNTFYVLSSLIKSAYIINENLIVIFGEGHTNITRSVSLSECLTKDVINLFEWMDEHKVNRS